MTENPGLLIDLQKIKENTRVIVEKCASYNINVVAVTKAVCGDPRVGRAMLEGGAAALADARIKNIKRLRQAGVTEPVMLLRSPMMSEIKDVVKYSSMSLNSEPDVLARLSECALDYGTRHDVIIMIDVGEIREGILPADIFQAAEEIKTLKGIRVIGAGTNLACYSGVRPTTKNMNLLLETGRELESILGYKLKIISGGNSSGLEMVDSGSVPRGINQFRIGESILLGRYLSNGEPIGGTNRDAFTLKAELIEMKEKPSLPMGEVGKNVFGDYAEENELQMHYRGIAALGRQDVPPDSILPLCPQKKIHIDVIGATSDHTVLDFGEDTRTFAVGSEVRFNLDYPGLLAAMTSPYINKEYIE
ncbi:alanine/ornithine racemase family PLP-dependent enzyme [Phosphitispora fastidiosa]|uniref:alanine/ornithine racemase family PLP-dependent enzyme n=1 Tax=Phosphitispora fastidiosa TaxID=2837202 RepID=UPI001E5AD7F5|nr:alanine/ornithine racemase family PLP-dependent enzyme [Phosphitispora fastidiosa]MBU7007850.1 putative amino acid racemase [Phosphitispora fastidiosa]